MDNELKVLMTAQADQLKAGMQQGAAAVQQSTQQMQTHMASLNSAISKEMDSISKSFSGSIKSMLSFGSIFGGMIAGALSFGALRGSIDAVTEYAGEVKSLMRVMGETAEEASVLNVALKMIGSSAEAYTAANMKLDRQLKTNEEGLNKIGIATRDENHHLLDQKTLFDNALNAMKQYKEGTDRNEFALYAFGRAGAEAAKFMILNEETMKRAAEVAKSYGLVLDNDVVNGVKKSSIEMNVMGLALDSLKIKMGQELLPTVARMTSEISQLAQIINFLVGVLRLLIQILDLAFTSLRVLADGAMAIYGTLLGVGHVLQGVFTAAYKVIVEQDYAGAVAALKTGYSRANGEVNYALGLMENNIKGYLGRIKHLWETTPPLNPPPPNAGGGSDKPFPTNMGTGATGSAGSKEEKTSTAEWSEELERLKISENAYYGWSIDRESTFWREKLHQSTEGGTQWWEVRKKLFDLAVRSQKEADKAADKAAEEAQASEQRKLEVQMQASEQSLQIKEMEIERKRELGQISDAEALTELRTVENTRFQLEAETYDKIAALYGEESQQFKDMMDKKLLVLGKYGIKLKENEDKQVKNTKETVMKYLQPIQSAISTSIQGMIQGTTTLKNAIANLCQSIAASFIDTIVKIATEWIANMITMAVTGKDISTESANTQITNNAGTAASGAASSQASIPYVGPVLAAAAAAAMFAMVIGYKSAAGGWDVPADSLTMVHGGEMILPAHISDGIRNMVAGGGSAGKGGETHVHFNVQAWDSHDVGQFFKKHGNALADGLKGPSRNFRFGK